MSKIEIVVEDRIEVRADLSIEQVESYLVRTGWTIICQDREWRSWAKEIDEDGAVGASVPLRPDYSDHALCMARTVGEIALAENRKPSAVLADIAKEPDDA